MSCLLAYYAVRFHNPYESPIFHPYVVLDGIWNETELKQLRELWMSYSMYQTVKEDATSLVTHIGEMTDVLPDGTCPHSYLTIRIINNQSKCVLPDRIDVAHHHFKSGGISGRKEMFEKMVGRLLAFNKILHRDSLSTVPGIETLFSSPKYLEAVATICPNNPVIDPIQLGIIILVPGQEVAVHYDVPWFKGATRYDFPQWLLVAMEQSGLFKDYLTPQIQGVAYIHRFNVTGGGFVFWNNDVDNNSLDIPAIPNTGIVLDGSVVAHGVYPFGHGDSLKMNPHHRYQLVENSGNWIIWNVDQEYSLNQTFEADDFRVSLVWRSRCFASEKEKQEWHQAPKMDIDAVLERLKSDLHRRGLLNDNDITSLDLAILIIETYIRYPYSKEAWIPLNYCLLSKSHPILTPILEWLCD